MNLLLRQARVHATSIGIQRTPSSAGQLATVVTVEPQKRRNAESQNRRIAGASLANARRNAQRD
ncbi:hypothetical protein RISK_001582 [Rhodopirellula islandica]|uniref:Uncharacterized protein n=1 Tax=Rhodopirellula islandica TaxID=595434 RepID=A0A0J1BIH4_RHOIS|nr:hypothetical protein RISK_001582 [Rhodopirellula islandica]